MIENNLLKSEKLKITSLKEEDIDVMVEWYEDTEFLRKFDFNAAAPMYRGRIKEWLLGEVNNPNNYFFALRTKEENEFIGYIEIDRINWNNRFGWLGLGIGNSTYRGKGYGTEGLSLIIDFAFRELNLHRLQLETISYNEGAIRLYEKLGFKKEGILRESIRRDGIWYDMYVYGILEREWGKIKSR